MNSKNWRTVILMMLVLSIVLVGCGSGEQEEDTTPPLNAATMDINNVNVAELGKDILGDEEFKRVQIDSDGDLKTVTIYYSPEVVWDERDLVKRSCNFAVDMYEQLFKNSKVTQVVFITEGNMTDTKGNTTLEEVVSLTMNKENAKDINWDNFSDMVLVDYNALLRIVDDYYIHPGVARNL